MPNQKTWYEIHVEEAHWRFPDDHRAGAEWLISRLHVRWEQAFEHGEIQEVMDAEKLDIMGAVRVVADRFGLPPDMHKNNLPRFLN